MLGPGFDSPHLHDLTQVITCGYDGFMNNLIERFNAVKEHLKEARAERDALRSLVRRMLNDENLPESIRKYAQKEMDESFV